MAKRFGWLVAASALAASACSAGTSGGGTPLAGAPGSDFDGPAMGRVFSPASMTPDGTGDNGPVAQPPPAQPSTDPAPMMMPVDPQGMTPVDPADDGMNDPIDPMDPMQDPDPVDPMEDPDPVDPMEDPDPVDPGEVGVSGIDPTELEMLRDVCVEEINMYRASISLAPLARASADRELCSDQGSKQDADNNAPHSSSGRGSPCNTGGGWNAFPNFQAQNTCPGWPVGGFGAATIAAALQGCLKSMWDEGVPTQGIEQCKQEYFEGNQTCFLAHGHYINMQEDYAAVSCGFYSMGNNRYWMNQDFL